MQLHEFIFIVCNLCTHAVAGIFLIEEVLDSIYTATTLYNYVYIYTYIYRCMYVCMYVYVCIYIYMCVYIYIGVGSGFRTEVCSDFGFRAGAVVHVTTAHIQMLQGFRV